VYRGAAVVRTFAAMSASLDPDPARQFFVEESVACCRAAPGRRSRSR
jgi:hypothetical protein